MYNMLKTFILLITLFLFTACQDKTFSIDVSQIIHDDCRYLDSQLLHLLVLAAIILAALIIGFATYVIWTMRQRAKLRKEIEEAAQAKLTLFANASQSFRTSFALITEPIQTMLEEGGLTERQKELMGRMVQQTNELGILADKVLSILQDDLMKDSERPYDADRQSAQRTFIASDGLKRRSSLTPLIDAERDIYRKTTRAASGSPGRNFYNHFQSFVTENISNDNLDIQQLSKEFNMSRVQLYRKCKTITGKSPIELIRLIRLRTADRLLHESDKTVSEIAYEVGFSSPSYFAKCYKEQFNESPTDVLKRNKERQ